jgi:hypothetical protein
MISMGSDTGKSTSALRLYPVVHLIAYLRRIRAASCTSDTTHIDVSSNGIRAASCTSGHHTY